jgi:hypothetical protein
MEGKMKIVEQKKSNKLRFLGAACGILAAIAAAYYLKDGGKTEFKEIGFSESYCGEISEVINKISTTGDYDSRDNVEFYKARTEKLKELNSIFDKNCSGRKIKVEKIKEKPLPETACGRFEQIMQSYIHNEMSPEIFTHSDLATTYADLAKFGCPENKDKYIALMERELKIANALDSSINITTCERIEKIVYIDNHDKYSSNTSNHFELAEGYAKLYQDGCPKNKEKFRAAAEQELEIFNILSKHHGMSDHEIMMETNKIRSMLEPEAVALQRPDSEPAASSFAGEPSGDLPQE